jgi:hypothetical protein
MAKYASSFGRFINFHVITYSVGMYVGTCSTSNGLVLYYLWIGLQNLVTLVRFDVFMAVAMNINAFLGCYGLQFGTKYVPYLSIYLAVSLSVCLSIYHTALCHILEDSNPHEISSVI